MTEVAQVPSVPTVPVPSFMVAELRVKIRSLAEEARIIRFEECRSLARRDRSPDAKHKAWHAGNYFSLRAHRIGGLRSEARAAQLAYAFLRERPYRTVEAKCVPKHGPDAEAVARIAHKFGGRGWDKAALPGVAAAVQAWLEVPAA